MDTQISGNAESLHPAVSAVINNMLVYMHNVYWVGSECGCGVECVMSVMCGMFLIKSYLAREGPLLPAIIINFFELVEEKENGKCLVNKFNPLTSPKQRLFTSLHFMDHYRQECRQTYCNYNILGPPPTGVVMYHTSADDPAHVVSRLCHKHSSESVLLGEYSMDTNKARQASFTVHTLYIQVYMYIHVFFKYYFFLLCVFVSGWVFIYLWFFLFPFSFFFLPLFFFWCAINVNFHVYTCTMYTDEARHSNVR